MSAVMAAVETLPPRVVSRRAQRAREAKQRRAKFVQQMILQHDVCHYCDWPIVDPHSIADKKVRDCDPLLATWDHRTPKSRGGKRGHNEVLACYTCNQRKGNRSEAEFMGDEARWLFQRRLDAPAVRRLHKSIDEPAVLSPLAPPEVAAIVLADLPLDLTDMAAKLAPMPVEEREAMVAETAEVDHWISDHQSWRYFFGAETVMVGKTGKPADTDWWRNQPKWFRLTVLLVRRANRAFWHALTDVYISDTLQ